MYACMFARLWEHAFDLLCMYEWLLFMWMYICTYVLFKVLREANTIMRMKRPMIEMEVTLKNMTGQYILLYFYFSCKIYIVDIHTYMHCIVSLYGNILHTYVFIHVQLSRIFYLNVHTCIRIDNIILIYLHTYTYSI